MGEAQETRSRRGVLPLALAVAVVTAGFLGAWTAISVLATRGEAKNPSSTATTTVTWSTGDSAVAAGAPSAQPAPPGVPTSRAAQPVLRFRGTGDTRNATDQGPPYTFQTAIAGAQSFRVRSGGTYRIDYSVSQGCASHWWMLEIVSDGAALQRSGWFISNGTDPATGSRSHTLSAGAYYVQMISTAAADSTQVNPDCEWSYSVYPPG
jgi:hypothetical protein